MSGPIAEAVASGTLPGRVWLYSNYHCNLACTYCLTASAPGAPRRELGADRMLALAGEARDLGFTGLGITGGEPFLLPWLPEVLAEMSELLPVVALSNGTLFAGARLQRLRPLAGRTVKIQISLDRAEPGPHDAERGEGGHAAAVGAIRRLRRLGIGVRVATTAEELSDDERERLCALHRELGVGDLGRGGEVVFSTELPGPQVAPAGLVALSDSKIVICAYLIGRLMRYEVGTGRLRTLAEGCRTGVVELTSGHLAYAGEDEIRVLERQ